LEQILQKGISNEIFKSQQTIIAIPDLFTLFIAHKKKNITERIKKSNQILNWAMDVSLKRAAKK
jgi:hypothetical protein